MMKSNTPISRFLTAFWLLALASTTVAHTWLENLRLIASNGSFVGAPGFPRAFIDREGNGNNNVNLIPSTPQSTDKICKNTQTVGTQSAGYPRLKAAAKDHVALRYEENGHVGLFATNPGKSLGRGVVYIYGTKDSKNTDTFLGVHGAWNADGTGGDKRGKLLATRNYDDGRCYQANPSAAVVATRAKQLSSTVEVEVLCQNDIQLPDDVGTSGTYALYWVWDWSTMYSNGNLQTNETYTACSDIDVVSSPVPDAGSFTAVQTGKNVNSVAIAEQMNKVFVVDPTKPLAVAPDNLGIVQPPGVQATAKRPVLNSLSAASGAAQTSTSPKATGKNPDSGPVSSAAPTSSTSPKITTPASSIAQSPKGSVPTPAPSGFVTVTVSVPITVATTVTVFASAQSPRPSVSFSSTQVAVSIDTKTSTPSAAPKATGGVFVSVAPSKATGHLAVSTASGLYSTGTTIPSPQPFLLGSRSARRGRRF